ncbi:hypothetical protein ACH5RR_029393 [Cinchona calisaya]|uniref:Uncharacterized protein n=1 Tax=Cinchona calisaya TaxID=153742 RepID=A0ABD2YUU2_9GENT
MQVDEHRDMGVANPPVLDVGKSRAVQTYISAYFCNLNHAPDPPAIPAGQSGNSFEILKTSSAEVDVDQFRLSMEKKIQLTHPGVKVHDDIPSEEDGMGESLPYCSTNLEVQEVPPNFLGALYLLHQSSGTCHHDECIALRSNNANILEQRLVVVQVNFSQETNCFNNAIRALELKVKEFEGQVLQYWGLLAEADKKYK